MNAQPQRNMEERQGMSGDPISLLPHRCSRKTWSAAQAVAAALMMLLVLVYVECLLYWFSIVNGNIDNSWAN